MNKEDRKFKFIADIILLVVVVAIFWGLFQWIGWWAIPVFLILLSR